MSIEAHDRLFATTIDERDARRQAMFRESAPCRLRRIALGTAWILKPERIGGIPALAQLLLRDLVSPAQGLPDPERTVNAAGLCGFVRDLAPGTLLEAYARGLIPFAHMGPLKWLSPDERCVLPVGEFHLGKNTRRLLRMGRHRVTFDRDFEGVLQACAGRRTGRWHLTWITPRIMHAFAALHDLGHAHSVEVWNESGALVGGGYGLAIGGVFFGESLFSRERDASKIGSAVLNWHLARHGFVLHDAKWMNPLMAQMGYRMVPRAQFRASVARAVARPGLPGRWRMEPDLAAVAAWQPGGAAPCPKPEDAKASRRLAPTLAVAAAIDIVDGSLALADVVQHLTS